MKMLRSFFKFYSIDVNDAATASLRFLFPFPGCHHSLWDHRNLARAGEGGAVGSVHQIPEKAAGGWYQGEV